MFVWTSSTRWIGQSTRSDNIWRTSCATLLSRRWRSVLHPCNRPPFVSQNGNARKWPAFICWLLGWTCHRRRILCTSSLRQRKRDRPNRGDQGDGTDPDSTTPKSSYRCPTRTKVLGSNVRKVNRQRKMTMVGEWVRTGRQVCGVRSMIPNVSIWSWNTAVVEIWLSWSGRTWELLEPHHPRSRRSQIIIGMMMSRRKKKKRDLGAHPYPFTSNN